MTRSHLNRPAAVGLLPMRTALLLALGLGGVIVGVQLLVPAAWLLVVQRLLTLSVLLLAMAVITRRGRQEPTRRAAWTWLLVALLIHALVVALIPILNKLPWIPPVVAPFYMLTMALGMTGWFQERLLWAGGVRRMLEGLLFALAVITLSSKVILGAQGALMGPTWIRLVFNIVTFAILLGIAVFEALVDLRRLKGPLGWLGLTLLGGCVINLLAIRAQLLGHWSPAYPSALLSPVNLLGLVLAAHAPWTRDNLTREEGRGQNPWGGALVYTPFALSLIWVLASLHDWKAPDPLLVLLVGTMAILLLVRQVIALRDQASFSRILQENLAARTRALEESQEVILRTQRLNLVATVGAGMAHDLNNLLGVVCTLAEQQGSREELVKTAHRAAALARKSMAHAGDPDATRELFDLSETLGHLQPILTRLAGPGIALSVDCAGDEAWMEADPLQVEQVLVNLVTNARDALSGQGTLEITLRVEGERCHLEVVDDGPGMTPEVLERIFDPFFTTKTKGAGTGLGLPSVKAFLDQVGGTLEVVSAPGQGTRFSLHLPRLTDC